MKKVFSIFIIMLFLFPIVCYAKASDSKEEEYANIVFFAYFRGSEDEIAEDIKYYEDNSKQLIDNYNGDYKRSFTNYLKEISYGKFNVKNIFPQLKDGAIEPIMLDLDIASAYRFNADTDIINQVLANYPNIKDTVDYNNDGFIDNVTIIVKSRNGYTALSNSSMTSHKSNYPGEKKYLNKYVGTYNIIGTASVDNNKAGVLAHEFLHSIGYSDLYRNSSVDDYPVYVWDIMASANDGMAYPLAYLRSYVSNWIDIDTVTESTSNLRLDLQSNKDGNQAYIIKSPLSDYEFFVVEYRKREFGIDMNILDRRVGGTGIIVYRVNTTVTGLSNYHGGTGIYVFRPNDSDLVSGINNAYLSLESGRTGIGSSNMGDGIEDGALTFSDGSNSGIVIKNVSSGGGEYMTFDVEIPDKSDYDLWLDTNLNDAMGSSSDKSSRLIVHNGKPYLIAFKGNQIRLSVYDNKSWITKSNYTLSSTYSDFLVDKKVIEYNNKIYLLYSDSTKLYIMEYNDSLNSWNNVKSINENVYSFDVNVINNKLYIACMGTTTGDFNTGFTNPIYVYEYGDTLTKLGERELTNSGNPKIVYMNNTVYITVRDADGTIELFSFTDGIFNKIDTNFNSYSYDVKVYNNKMYFVLGQMNSDKLKLHIYDGDKWSVINTLYDAIDPQIVISGGNLYILANENSNMKVYSLDYKNSKIEQEGHVVDSSGDSIDASLISIGNTIYVSLKSAANNNIIVKSKETINKLESITIIPPTKLSYMVGDDTDLTGLKVIANYTMEQVYVTNYEITDFDTSKPGCFDATITYEGVSNTFSYEVFEEVDTIRNIDDVLIDSIPNQVYTGSNIEPKLNLNYYGMELVRDIDYKVTFSNNKNIGTSTVTITGIGKYSGTRKINFNIVFGTPKLRVSSQTTNSIKLTWNKVAGAKGYTVYKYDSKKKKYVAIKTLTGNSLTVSKLSKATTYKFYVVAYYQSGNTKKYSPKSNILTTSTKTINPTISSIKTKNKSITFTWRKVSGATGYEVYRATSKNGKYTKVATTSSLKYVDSNLVKGKKYYYKIRTYRTVNGVKIYSGYSKVRYIKCK